MFNKLNPELTVQTIIMFSIFNIMITVSYMYNQECEQI